MEARIDPAYRDEAAQQQARPNEQHERKGNFCDHK